jgi:hypothetical protein
MLTITPLMQFTEKGTIPNKYLQSADENHTIPDVLLWRGRARYRPHITDMQEPSGIERRDMAITNNTPGSLP